MRVQISEVPIAALNTSEGENGFIRDEREVCYESKTRKGPALGLLLLLLPNAKITLIKLKDRSRDTVTTKESGEKDHDWYETQK